MNSKEERVFLETRIRNLERWLSKMLSHADLVDECLEIKSEINSLKEDLKLV